MKFFSVRHSRPARSISLILSRHTCGLFSIRCVDVLNSLVQPITSYLIPPRVHCNSIFTARFKFLFFTQQRYQPLGWFLGFFLYHKVQFKCWMRGSGMFYSRWIKSISTDPMYSCQNKSYKSIQIYLIMEMLLQKTHSQFFSP